MIQSMTGFGRSESTLSGSQVTVEIKTVNHRYCEVQTKLPKRYAAVEERLRQHLVEVLARGKVDLFVKAEHGEGVGQEIRVDKGLARKYHGAMLELSDAFGMPMNFGVNEMIALPGILSVDDAPEETEQAWAMLVTPVSQALSQVLDMRRMEGGRLAADFHRRLDGMEKLRQELSGYAAGVVESYKSKLEARIAELTGRQPVDESRLAQEVAMIADKSSVDEELIRLDSHFLQFKELLDSDQPVGRKLDFLCQEIHREINTIGSKANDLSMTKIVVEVKSELEKLREQVQNIR